MDLDSKLAFQPSCHLVRVKQAALDNDEVVGAYTVGSGNSAQTHGFTWRPGYGFTTVDDPQGIGTTIINGVNDHGALVGFYTDSAGNTDGMLALP